jgi:membrane protease YdiL (CAAX protease family)
MYTQTIKSTNEFQREKGIQPLGWIKSLLLFGIPSILMFISFHLGIPWLERAGLTSFQAFIVANTFPMVILFVSAFIALISEQSITSIDYLAEALRERMRFSRLTFKTILQGIGLYLVLLIAGLASGLLNQALIGTNMIPLPENLPLLLDPHAAITSESLSGFVAGPLAGNWEIILLFSIQLFFNIAGEELWWRGYILPRQELAFGRWAWLVHGLLWWAFHIFKWWDLMTVLPLVLILTYVAQRTKNNWLPTIAHLLANSLLFLILVAGVLGFMN